MIEKEKLKDFSLLKNLNEDELLYLVSLSKSHEFNKDDIIIKEGDVGSLVYLLIDGLVDVIKTTIFNDSYVCATLSSKDHAIFGEMALLDNDKRSATIKAKTKCICISLDKDAFDEYCKKYPNAAIELLKLMNINLIKNLRKENENLKLVYQALIEEIETK